MQWLELIFWLLIAVLFGCLGWKLWKREQIALLHDYHYQKVKDTDRKPYTALMGKAMLLIGTGAALAGIIDFATDTLYGWYFFGICFCVGLMIMIYAQIKYNHGIF